MKKIYIEETPPKLFLLAAFCAVQTIVGAAILIVEPALSAKIISLFSFLLFGTAAVVFAKSFFAAQPNLFSDVRTRFRQIRLRFALARQILTQFVRRRFSQK